MADKAFDGVSIGGDWWLGAPLLVIVVLNVRFFIFVCVGWKVDLLFDAPQRPVWLIWFAFVSHFCCYKLRMRISMW